MLPPTPPPQPAFPMHFRNDGKPDTPHSNGCISQKTYPLLCLLYEPCSLHEFKHTTTVASLTILPDHLKSLTNVLLPLNCATVECSLELASRFSSVQISRLNSGEEIAKVIQPIGFEIKSSLR
ncbi:hypothetical protein RHMOL_Rhmol09G0054700 [Rhododendron molle]|uniref:Uncharacterized protein n=1 Tax=Rhododendron molle TaxID=49168 RepID=A0ACC0MBQ6_RHOML|nr:hypothetical protein RHMOL_Rhmol09G0054700 [Rhododendron molle]